MLYNRNPLYFPKLRFVKEGQLVRTSTLNTNSSGGNAVCTDSELTSGGIKSENIVSGRPIDIYKLDWSKQEEIIRTKHEEWKKQYHPDKKLPFIGQLPDEWDNWVKSLVFAINPGYLKEIRYWSQNALNNWNRSNYASADTMVREVCLNPAIEMIRVAFFLIADCVYDPEARWYSRSGKDNLAQYAMTYKFWVYQTGRGLLKSHARFHKLEWGVRESVTAIHDPNNEFIVEGRKFLADIEKYEGELDTSYEELCITMEDPTSRDKQEGKTSK